jgi:molybdate transport system substrate-binding protein
VEWTSGPGGRGRPGRTGRRWCAAIAALAGALVLWPVLAPTWARADDRPPAPELTVYAAASLQDALGAVGTEYTKSTGVRVKFSFAASSLLARQIEAGAPADVYVSADPRWTDYLARRGAVAASSVQRVAGNRLVLIAPADAVPALRIAMGFPLAGALGGGRLAIAEPTSVPAGRYAQQALQALGVWDGVAARLVGTEDVRGALALVARGEAPLGIVYATDALAEPRVRVVDTFPATLHSPIEYTAAVVRGSGPRAPGFVAFLRSAAAASALRRHGFTTN